MHNDGAMNFGIRWPQTGKTYTSVAKEQAEKVTVSAILSDKNLRIMTALKPAVNLSCTFDVQRDCLHTYRNLHAYYL